MKSIFNQKKIAILGFGKEGKSTLSFIQKYSVSCTVDIYDEQNLELYFKKENYKFIHLKSFKDYDFKDYDFIIKSPGISTKKLNIDLLQSEKLTSQTELFLKHYNHQVIGITGTKGKSTTTSLLYHVLKQNLSSVFIAGNIGVPFFDIITNISDTSIVIAELSCHQLENISYSPHIAVLLNIFEEHLDHYNTKEDYFETKLNILKFQNYNDFAFVNLRDEIISQYIQKIIISSKIIDFSKSFIDFPSDFSPKLKGKSNLLNIQVVCEICKILNLSLNPIFKQIEEFTPLKYRLEFIGVFKQKIIYNDSISTTPKSTIMALQTLEKVDSLILGGFDRGINFQKLYDFLNQYQTPIHLCFFDKSGIRMMNEFRELKRKKCSHIIHFSNDFNEIVKIAFQNTKPNRICLLSPSSPSYGKFKNFEEKGNLFNNLIFSMAT